MAVKDVKQYYEEVCNQYQDMLNEIKELEEQCKEEMVSPDILANLKEMIQPLMTNYQMISYVMFLLNKPVKKSKHDKYEKINKKLLNSIEQQNTKEGVMKTNDDVISNINHLIEQ